MKEVLPANLIVLAALNSGSHDFDAARDFKYAAREAGKTKVPFLHVASRTDRGGLGKKRRPISQSTTDY
jgi:hypothetical protein